MNELYKIDNEKTRFTARELDDCRFGHAASDHPDDPQLPYAEWYCENSDCVVREVRIRMKLYGSQIPKLFCPACKQRLKFHNYLVGVTFVKVAENPCQRHAQSVR